MEGFSETKPRRKQQKKGPALQQDGSKLLYVDILNYSTQFFTSKNFWNLKIPKRNIEEFYFAALNAGWWVSVFVDAANATEEANKKWIKRREKQVEEGEMNVPPNLSRMIGEMFQQVGATVHYSSVDNDDTLASMAHKEGAAVLSRDKDFFRYKDSRFLIFYDYQIVKEDNPNGPGKRSVLKLKKARPPPRDKWPSLRQLMDPVPFTYSHYPNAELILSYSPLSYMRGCPSTLVKEAGNIHLLVRPIRQAFYHLIGIKSGVKEFIPYWDTTTQTCKWTDDLVTPDPSQSDLLLSESLTPALDHYLPLLTKPESLSETSLAWHNHIFALASILAELKSQVKKPILNAEEVPLGGAGVKPDKTIIGQSTSLVQMLEEAHVVLKGKGVLRQCDKVDGLVKAFDQIKIE